MMTLDEGESRFRRLKASRAECPLCGAYDVDYEFVLDQIAFSLCRACNLLFASARTSDPGPDVDVDVDAMVAVEEIMSAMARYVGHVPKRSVVVAPALRPAFGNIPVRQLRSLQSDETFDAIVVLDAVGREDDPVEMLEAVGRHIEPGGAIALLSPSTASRVARRERSSWEPLRRGGRYFFSTDNLQLLATRCGLGDFISFTDARDMKAKPSEKLTSWFRSNVAILCRPVARDPSRLLSVIFPVYNESATVEESLLRVLHKDIPGIDIEVVIVESNSTDGSRAVVERYREHPRVRLVLEDRPRGKGYAVRAGLRHARGEVVLFQDADLEYDTGDYDKLVAPLFELRRNFVLGSRHNARGEAWKIRHFADQPGVSTVANVAHMALLTMFNTLYRQSLRDPFTMYKVFRRDCLYGLTFECNRFDFDFEINIKLLRKGYEALEIPANYSSRSFADGKKVSFFGDPPTWIRAMLKLRRSPLYGALLR